MKIAISITKVLEVVDMDLAELKYQFEREDFEENGIDWYDIEPQEEIWSFAIIDEGKQ